MRTGSIPVGPTKYGVEASTVMQWTVNPPALPRLVRSQDTPPNKWNGPIMVLERIANPSSC
jgi:hypothetical protein